MKRLARFRKSIAAGISFVLTCQLMIPIMGYALTSGPAQPEMKGFEQAGISNLVDAFTGDFTYNIPLMDIDGYPVNIAYHSGSGMDDEASWVGFGWSLSPGVIDRQMRGLPDDFNGQGKNGDYITKTVHLRDDITAGVDLNFAPEVFGFNTGQVLNAGVQAGIFYNNRRGLGIQFGLNANAPLLSNSKASSGMQTASLAAGASLSVNSQNGVSFNPNINYAITASNLLLTDKNTSRLSLGGSFQSRAGLQAMTLAASFQHDRVYKETKKQSFSRSAGGEFSSSSVSYAAQPFLPESELDFINQSYAVSPQFGPEAWGFFAGLQLTGHYAVQKPAHTVSTYGAYGFMHCREGQDDLHGLMDFNREKDVPYYEGVPNLPVPVATPDLFMVHTQDGSAQYRGYLGGTGIFSDPRSDNTSVSASLGIELGAGAGFKAGADLQASLAKTTTTKWKTGNHLLFDDNNSYDNYGNFTGIENSDYTGSEPVYFKRVGEQVPEDGSLYDMVKADLPVRVKTSGDRGGPSALNAIIAQDGTETTITHKIARTRRDTRSNTFSFLTNDQVRNAGLDKKIIDYYKSAGGFKPLLNNCGGNLAPIPQQDYRKGHHIGEITITDEGGARKVFGIPAYTTYQEDLGFSIGENLKAEDKARGLVNYSPADASVDNKNGIDHFFSKETIPGYAYAFLLTGILSADYTDLTGDGITDDDPGTAIRFNYWRKTDAFQWRTPYAAGKANYNEGLLSDQADNRANYSYGRKELWYLHSISSKNMVAVFETGNREDALGADAAGNPDSLSSNRQQYLKTIKLYAKAGWNKDPQHALPLKTVHFVYDYSLFSDNHNPAGKIPNNTGNAIDGNPAVTSNEGGKLTLKKIYFTYQENTSGALQPYTFQYAANKKYEWKQYDRWGNYKNMLDDNPAGVSNDYFPYSTQDKIKADANAANWQLTAIRTPAGGIVHVQYEADDYLYVQNRKAMQMYPLAGLGAGVNSNNKYYRTNKILVKLPERLSSEAELRAKYFDGGASDYNKNLFFKAFVKLKANETKYDYVSGYAVIDNINNDVKLVAGHPDLAEITLKTIKGEGVSQEYHPLAKAAWQFMRLNTPGLVYPGYNVREDLAPVQFVKALVGAIRSITELLAPFDTRAEINQLAGTIDLSKSWVRLNAGTNETKKQNGASYYAKLGGGSRVKEISISDEWAAMSSSGVTASYGLVYDYTTRIQLSNGETVTASSGVASYEPMIGNEENPFHQPSRYQQKIKLGPDNAFFIDEPLCESYFPAAGVGYSKVTVRNRGADGKSGVTGYSVNEFYTQKDYPTTVDHTPIDAKSFGGLSVLQALKIKRNNSRVLSQGYTVGLNDMHGKPKSEKIFDGGNHEQFSAEYYYKTENSEAPEKKLDNHAAVLQNEGTVRSAVLARDVEMYTDMRSQTTLTAGVNVMMNLDAIYLLFAIVPIPVILPLPNAEYLGFRSASTVKVIQQYGILDKIIKRQNGSRLMTENLAWDAETGAVLLTRTQNEFDDPVYHLSYPAHWMYEGMGQAYKNLGLVIPNFSTINGVIAPSAAASLLMSGDELLLTDNKGNGKRYWVNNTGTSKNPVLVLIDESGLPITASGYATVIRSGRRNMAGLPVGTLVSLINPIKNGKLDIGVFTEILDAGSSTYNEEWAVNAKQVLKTTWHCPEGFQADFFGRCYQDFDTIAEPSYNTNTLAIRQRNIAYSTCGTLLNNLSDSYLSGSAADPPLLSRVSLHTNFIWQNGVTNCGTGGAGDEDGPLNRSGIWLAERKSNNYYGQWVGIKAKVYISRADAASKSADGKTGYLFLGFGSQHSIEVRIDNVIVAARDRNIDGWITSPLRAWRIKPIQLTLDRQHEIFIRVKNELVNSTAAMGVELYNNTYNQIRAALCVHETCLPCEFCSSCRTAADSTDQACKGNYANIIWSTKCLLGKRFNYHADASGSPLHDFDPVCQGVSFTGADCEPRCKINRRKYVNKIGLTSCAFPDSQPINPYVSGLRGNWRLQQSFVYHTDRNGKPPYITPGDPDFAEKTDIRHAGTYTTFSPFWKFRLSQWLPQPLQPVPDINWVTVTKATGFNRNGQEWENTDALNRFNAVQFGYGQSVVTAIASNANETDIGYDGFEDYNVNTGNCNQPDTCNLEEHFSFRNLSLRYPSGIVPDTRFAHTGRYSLYVSPGVADASIMPSTAMPGSHTNYTISNNTMFLLPGVIRPGFAPHTGKQYLLSAWIKDDGNNIQLGSAVENAKAAVDIEVGGRLFSSIKAGPAVEGWRKVELVFTLPANTQAIRIKLRPGNRAAWFDDIRIQPFNAQLKTYAYDNRSMRLWAELDENNFATFYEYDDEGILIRLKKETEKGIMTVKETRSAYKTKP